MYDIPKYDGIPDLQDHFIEYTTGVKGKDLIKLEIEQVLVKKFEETLIKDALTWFSLLSKNSTSSFDKLAKTFVKAYIGAQKVENLMKNIFKIWKKNIELLQEFVNKFQRESILLSHVLDNWVATAFVKNLNNRISKAIRRLKESLQEFPPIT